MPPAVTAATPLPSLPGLDAAALAEALRSYAAIDGAWVFGSAAQGRMRPDSDVDLGVLFRDDAARARYLADPLLLLGALCIAAGRAVHLIDVATAPIALRLQIARHGVAVIDDDPGRTRRWRVDTLVAWCDFEPAWRHALGERAQRRAR